ncbi:MAG: glutaredoxin family protein [Candidatus Methylacidiphilales bacterium]
MNSTTMNQPHIIAYLKPWCGWSNGVRAIMKKYGLPFEDRDIINDPAQRMEMIQKSRQELSPCVEVNGHMLADVSGEEVEAYLLEKGLVSPNEVQPDVPIDRACSDEEHAAMRSAGTIRFISGND